MMFFVIFFCSPLYFLLRQKWMGFIINSVLYGLALLFLLTFFLAFMTPVFWMFAVAHAGWVLRDEMMQNHANAVGTAVAMQMQQQRDQQSA